MLQNETFKPKMSPLLPLMDPVYKKVTVNKQCLTFLLS